LNGQDQLLLYIKLTDAAITSKQNKIEKSKYQGGLFYQVSGLTGT